MKLDKITSKKHLLAGLSLVILIEIIGLAARSTPPVETISSLTMARLPMTINSGADNASLSADFAIIAKATAQEKQDQTSASLGINDARYRLSDVSSEKTRRLKLIAAAESEVAAATQLSSAQASLVETNLSAVKHNLIDPQLSAKQLDADYQSFASLVTAVELIKVADDQQTISLLLNQLSDKLNASINTSGISGLTYTDLQADLTTLSSDTAATKNLAGEIEKSLSNNSSSAKELATDHTSLKTAELDLQVATNAAQTIFGDLKQN